MARGSHVGNARAASIVAEPTPRALAPGLREALAVSSLALAVLVAIIVTYTRLTPADLYNTSVDGLRGGLGRALVSVGFPVSLIALVVIGVLANALVDTHRRLVAATTLVAIPLCLTTPFVVKQGDLDAAAGNVLPAIGVALVGSMLVIAVRERGLPPTPPARGDRIRVAVCVLLGLLAIPWAFALLGFYAPGPFIAEEPSPDEPLAAVHLGMHHGLDGTLVALAGLALSRALPSFRHRRLATVTSPLLALAVAWGVANALQDFTLEQLWKRDTIEWKPPSVLMPAISWGWLAVLGAAVLVELAFRLERRAAQAPRSPM